MNRYIQPYKIKAVFLILALLFQFNLRAADYIIISEVMYDTPLNEQIATGVAYSNGEFVEIYNAGSNVVNLTGWTLKGGGSTEIYNFPDNTLLNPNKYIIIAYQYNNSNFTLDQLFSNFITTADKQVFYQRKIVLSNSGEALKLLTPEGVTKDSLYIDGTINKTKPDRLSAPNEDNSPGNYCVSLQRKTSVFDNNANAITNNLEWESAPISFYKHIAAYLPPTNVPGVINSAISLDYNYIVTVSPLDNTEAVEIENGKIILQNEARSHINIQYFDGLGRPIQTLQKGITPDNSDLVTYTEYDGLGREYKQWLPIKSTGNGAFTELGTFLSNQSDLYGGDTRPFSETKYEPSPLNRIIEQYGPGQDWKNNNKSIKTAYLTNANDILYFYIGGNNSLHKGPNYDANSLYKTETADEDGNITVEYKDKQGKVILTQSFDGGNPVSTYYVYNDLDQLSYVIPPKAVDELTPDLSDENQVLKELCYLYKYDERGNCIKKRLPGCDWINMVYDMSDRLILSQDGNQRLKTPKEWTVTKYDKLGRIIYTGVTTDDTTHDNLIADLSDEIITEDWNPNNDFSDIGYTCNRFVPQGLLTVNYYDNYDFVSITDTELSYDNSKESEYGIKYSSAKGLLTGTRTYLLSTPSVFTASAIYYDYRGRTIQTRASNHLGGYDILYSQIDFSGNVTKSHKEHNTSGQNTVKEIYNYTYDHAGRLGKTFYNLNDDSEPVLLSDLSESDAYDDLGRLKIKKRHNGTDIETFAYNIRNWTTKITSGSFEQELFYNTMNFNNVVPRYNGNIAMSTWTYNGVKSAYTYTYDQLNRLTEANSYKVSGYTLYAPNNMEKFDYDKQGNIIRLWRQNEYSLVDFLQLYYNGNQLNYINDSQGSQNLYNLKEYPNKSTATSGEFNFDANGNMIKDSDRDIVTIRYNLLNLPDTIQFKNGHQIVNNYDASGRKLNTSNYTVYNIVNQPIVEIGSVRDIYMNDGLYINGAYYVDNIEYNYIAEYNAGELTYEEESLQCIYNQEGYIKNPSTKDYHYYRRDHIGNNREVWRVPYTIRRPQGIHRVPASTVQRTQYYPSGLPWASNSGDSPEYQCKKYNGKEFVEMHGLDEYDSEARWYYPAIMRTTTIDPLAEKYYSISPYAWCANNPVRVIDPTGMWVETENEYSTSDPDEIDAFLSQQRNRTQRSNQGEEGFNLVNFISDYLRELTSINIDFSTPEKKKQTLVNIENRKRRIENAKALEKALLQGPVALILSGNFAAQMYTGGIDVSGGVLIILSGKDRGSYLLTDLGAPILSTGFSISGGANLTPVFFSGDPNDFKSNYIEGLRVEINSSIPSTPVTFGGFKSLYNGKTNTFGIYIGIGKSLELKGVPSSQMPFQINMGSTQIYK